ncbi:MAG: 3-deoxy-8-phosphooctulonate synthase [Candidatus Eisenbacteria bacterium]|uniref:3-deoxy-8-phosphooctulonate synthase n=1 Tax=Eiseniibacteriota bacterium TaxID=2212470 RepID=A0A938BS01_UNCEI|nr:3-deoxy-8-phosphooctulonate synthase [Candidatus Eisenbacteria bacterium]
MEAPGAARCIPEDARRPFVIAGPCVLEGEAMALRVAESLAAACRARGLAYVFKASYMKDNRTAEGAYSGPGLAAGLALLARVRREVGVPVLTDVHAVDEVAPAAEAVDILQVPAFLCRQTRLLRACAASGRAVNIKKGQFLAMRDIARAVEKARAARPQAEILLTERGTFFGYHDLVVDMRAIAYMRTLGARVVFDVTHALQHPGCGGCREFARPLARAGLGAGAEGIFAEVHPDPPRALSDATTQLALADAPALIDEWARLGDLVRGLEGEGPRGLTPGDEAPQGAAPGGGS